MEDKTTMRTSVCVAIAALALAGIAGCSSTGASPDDKYASSSATSTYVEEHANSNDEGTTNDFGWVKFDLPKGYTATEDDYGHIIIGNDADEDEIIKVRRNPLGKDAKDAAALAKQKIKETKGAYTDDGRKSIGGLDWHLVGFKWIDGADSQIGYANIDSGHAVVVASFMKKLDDPSVMMLLDSMDFDELDV